MVIIKFILDNDHDDQQQKIDQPQKSIIKYINKY